MMAQPLHVDWCSYSTNMVHVKQLLVACRVKRVVPVNPRTLARWTDHDDVTNLTNNDTNTSHPRIPRCDSARYIDPWDN